MATSAPALGIAKTMIVQKNSRITALDAAFLVIAEIKMPSEKNMAIYPNDAKSIRTNRTHSSLRNGTLGERLTKRAPKSEANAKGKIRLT